MRRAGARSGESLALGVRLSWTAADGIRVAHEDSPRRLRDTEKRRWDADERGLSRIRRGNQKRNRERKRETNPDSRSVRRATGQSHVHVYVRVSLSSPCLRGECPSQRDRWRGVPKNQLNSRRPISSPSSLLRRSSRRACIWLTRDSLLPRTLPISRMVMSSK